MRLLVSALVALLASGPTVRQNWEQADAATVRLRPTAFASLPSRVRQELERRGCTVPQSYSESAPHNVIRGRFTSGGHTDIAVLCSKERASSILVFRGGSTANVAELARKPDVHFVQVAAASGAVGYARALGTAEPKEIQEHHQRYGGPAPPPLDHDGIEDIFVGKASVVWYWSGGRWRQLQGAD
jgi:hypothetical protein